MADIVLILGKSAQRYPACFSRVPETDLATWRNHLHSIPLSVFVTGH
jgi:hypothetical protein